MYVSICFEFDKLFFLKFDKFCLCEEEKNGRKKKKKKRKKTDEQYY